RPPRRGRRTKDVLTLGQVPLPRRVLLGLPTESVLDLSLDDAARTLVAFQMLQETGRARLPGAGARPPDAPGTTTSAVAVDAAPNQPAGPPSSAAALSVSGCIACGVCVRACPHDALVLEHADG